MIFRHRFIGLAVFSVWLVILVTACAPQVPSSPSSVPQLPPPQTSLAPEPVKWSADGVITDGEYTGAGTFDDYEIHWTSDGNHVYIGMKAKTSGWLAVGTQPGTTMKDADMVMGFVSDGKATVYDLYSTGDYGPHPQDTELGGTNDILEFGGKEVDGYTTIEFKRLLDTGDKYDRPFSKGTNEIIWSYGSDDQSTKKHVSRGLGQIDL
jgi:DOMON domain